MWEQAMQITLFCSPPYVARQFQELSFEGIQGWHTLDSICLLVQGCLNFPRSVSICTPFSCTRQISNQLWSITAFVAIRKV